MNKALEILKAINNHDETWYIEIGGALGVEQYIREAISELEEAMKPKYCTSCIHASIGINVVICGRQGTYCEDNFCCNKYEPKESV